MIDLPVRPCNRFLFLFLLQVKHNSLNSAQALQFNLFVFCRMELCWNFFEVVSSLVNVWCFYLTNARRWLPCLSVCERAVWWATHQVGKVCSGIAFHITLLRAMHFTLQHLTDQLAKFLPCFRLQMMKAASNLRTWRTMVTSTPV